MGSVYPNGRSRCTVHGTIEAAWPNRQVMIHTRADITNPRLLVAKGVMFVVCGLLASAGVIVTASGPTPWWTVLLLQGVSVWSFCRAYYFAFYVIERYIDPSCRYAGLWSAARAAWTIARTGRTGRT